MRVVFFLIIHATLKIKRLYCYIFGSFFVNLYYKYIIGKTYEFRNSLLGHEMIYLKNRIITLDTRFPESKPHFGLSHIDKSCLQYHE